MTVDSFDTFKVMTANASIALNGTV